MFIKIDNRYINLNFVVSFTDIAEIPATPSTQPDNESYNYLRDNERHGVPARFAVTLLNGSEINLPPQMKGVVIAYLEKNLLN